MTIYSKVLPHLHNVATCRDIFHPNTVTCSSNFFDQIQASGQSCYKGLILFYLIQYFLKRSHNFSVTCQCFIRSLLHLVLGPALYITGNCLIRNSLKRFNRFFLGFGCGAIAELSVLFEHPSRRNAINLGYMNLLLEYFFGYMDQNGYHLLTRQTTVLVTLFMISNGVLLYKLKKNYEKYSSFTLWFFNPPKSKISSNLSEHNECYHKGQCWRKIIKPARTYFSTGAAVQLIKTIIEYKTSGRFHIKTLFDFRLPLFVTSYVAMFQTVTCWLYRYKRKDESIHTFLGGLISGSLYILYPNKTILFAVWANLIRMFSKDIKEGLNLPNLPYRDVFTAIMCGGLLHSVIFHHDIAPKIFKFILNILTKHRSDAINNRFQTFIYNNIHLIA